MINAESTYLQQIAELGELQSVTCTENIITVDGAKLLPKGASINRQVIERLLHHKLLKPIDFTTQIEDAVDHNVLITVGQSLMERTSEMGNMVRMMRNKGFVEQSCKRIHLELPIQNKLTVAQKLRPELLEHSLRVTLAITILGEELGLPEKELEILATAGLLHDIGELHLGVGDLPLDQNLDLDHWQQVRSHPLVGATILKQFPMYAPHIARAVQEHHERLDGSGYPQGLKAIRISRAGRLLAFTELAIGALRKYSLRQLSTIIKTNLDALDPQPVSVFLQALSLYENSGKSQAAEIHAKKVTSLFELVSKLILAAEKIAHDRTPEQKTSEPCLLDSELVKFNQAMSRAGFDIRQVTASMAMIGEDQESLSELEGLLQETLFQLRHMLLEMQRRFSETHSESSDRAAIQQWVKEAEQNLNTAAQLFA
jgi:putative nucleotidyltransferase with HDIG domain